VTARAWKLLGNLASGPAKSEGLDPDRLRQATRADRRTQRPGNESEIRDQAERLHELAVLSLFLHSAGTLEEMLALFLERAPRVTGAVVTYPLLFDRRREVLSATALATIDDPGLEQASVAANENLVDLEYPLPLRSWRRTVMEGGEVAVTDDLRDVLGDVLGKHSTDAIRKDLEITRIAVVPLVMEGEAFGICVFMFSGREPDVEVLELAAGHCTLALKALMVGEETTRFGGIDPVTWAHSRGHFLEALEAEVGRARRYGRGLSVIFFDIDEFGEFNAEYGHTMGDRLLRSVAMALASAAAAPEMVARYGGDEFAMLLPESHRALAVELAQRIVGKLDALNIFDTESEQRGVAVSMAIVSYPEDGGTREELLASAEAGLEQSKTERASAKHPPAPLTPVQQLRMASRRPGA